MIFVSGGEGKALRVEFRPVSSHLSGLNFSVFPS